MQNDAVGSYSQAASIRMGLEVPSPFSSLGARGQCLQPGPGSLPAFLLGAQPSSPMSRGKLLEQFPV